MQKVRMQVILFELHFGIWRLDFRETDLKWNGWGYRDSFFFVNDKDQVEFNGEKRYGLEFLALYGSEDSGFVMFLGTTSAVRYSLT